MASLKLFGWTLTLSGGSDSFTVGRPPEWQEGDRFWNDGDFTIKTVGGRPSAWLKLSALTLDKVNIWLAISNLPLEQVGPDFRVRQGNYANRIFIRMSRDQSAKNLIRIGPARLSAFTLKFDPNDPLALGHIQSDEDLSFPGPGKGTPLGLEIPTGAVVLLNLAARSITLPKDSVRATLSVFHEPDPAATTSEFLLRNERTIAFSNMVEGRVEELPLTFRKADDRPVPLNVDPQSGRVELEAFEADLDVTIRAATAASPAFVAPNSIITSARLVEPPAGKIALRFLALRNSRNQAEEWRTRGPVKLGFRRPDTAAWRSALILPGPDSVELVRLNGTIRVGKELLHLPMHSWFGNSQFEMNGDTRARMVCTKDTAVPHYSSSSAIAAELLWSVTKPWLQLGRATLRQGRPGDSFGAADGAKSGATHWQFEVGGNGMSGAVPALGQGAWHYAPANSPVAALATRLVDQSFAELKLIAKDAVHETGLKDVSVARPSITAIVPGVKAVLVNGLPVSSELERGEIWFDDHQRKITIGAPIDIAVGDLPVLDVPFSVPVAQSADYAVFWPGGAALKPAPPMLDGIEAWGNLLAKVIDQAAPIRLPESLVSTNWPSAFPQALVKLSRRKSLDDILNELGKALPDDAARANFKTLREKILPAIIETDPDMLKPAWMGVVLFNAPIDFSQFAALAALVPTDPLDANPPRFAFFAVSPRDARADRSVAVSAAVNWENKSGKKLDDATPADDQEEAFIRPEELKVNFRDSHLTRFHSRASFRVRSFMGLVGDRPNTFDIIGSVRQTTSGKADAKSYEVRFAVEVSGGKDLRLYPLGSQPDGGENFFVREASLRRLEVVDRPDGNARKAEMQIDGSIEFQQPGKFSGDYANFFQSLRHINFEKLRIDLDALTSADPRALRLHYPSLNFDLNLPHIDLLNGALRLKFHQFIVDFAKTFDFGGMIGMGVAGLEPPDIRLPRIVFLGRIDFGSLPDIFARKLSGFALEGAFGFNFDKGALKGKPFALLRGFGFSGLNLDLASFITLRIDDLKVTNKDFGKVKGSVIQLQGGSLSILDVPVIKNLSGAYFSLAENKGDGFWALLSEPLKTNLISFNWAFASRNVDFSPDIAKKLLAPPKLPSTDGSGGGIDEPVAGMGKDLSDAWDGGKLGPASSSNTRGWAFAASISMFGEALQGRALFQDGGFMGLSLNGPMLDELLGWKFAFTGIYRKDITPGEDYFYFSMTLPQFTLGSVRFTGGEIALELYTSGDFFVDFGFPWPAPAGSREWQRTIGAIVTPGQASGGFYLRKRRHMVPQGKELVLAGGYAVQWGLGATFGNGRTFSVWVRIGLYAILEGEFTLLLKNDGKNDSVEIIGIHVKGAAGILLEGAGEIDWWVINVRVGVRASAEIRAEIDWKPKEPVTMRIAAELHVSAHARACIGPRWARVCKGISVGLTIPVRHDLKFS